MSLLSAPITSPLHAVELGLAKHPAFAGHHPAQAHGAGAPAGQHVYEANSGTALQSIHRPLLHIPCPPATDDLCDT
jgi:hypothetical protein